MTRRVMRGGVVWEVDALPEDAARAVFEWAAGGSAATGAIVSDRRVRRMIRIPTRQGCVYLKHDRFRGPLAALRFFVVPSRARTEWEVARRLAEQKVPTVRALAVGERRKGGFLLDSFLVTAGIDTALPLDVLLGEGRTPPPGRGRGRWRRQVVRALADVVARLHRAGFWHRDLHLGNVLAQPLGDAGLTLTLIDLQKARAPSSFGPRHWVYDLAWLDYSASRWASKTDRLRFLCAYLRVMPAWRTDLKKAARAVASASAARARFHRARRMRRAGRRGGLFEAHRAPWGRVIRAEDFPMERVAAAVAAERDAGPEQVLRSTSRTRVVRLRLADGAPVCVKRYHPGPWGMLSRDRASAAWRAAEGCRMRGIETPRALALVDRLRGTRDALLVMEDLGHLPWLTHHAAIRLRDPRVSRARRAEEARALGEWLRRLHGDGVRHADLKAGNILVRETPMGPRFVILDIEDVDFPRALSRADRERALVQLNASLPAQVGRTDRLRAFLAYARGGIFGSEKETRTALARIVGASIRRAHRWGPRAEAWRPEPEGYGREA